MGQHGKPRVDFYKLNGRNSSSIGRFCCQLTDKVVKLGHTVFIRTGSETETQALDDLLWTWSDSSFLPHAKLGDGDDCEPPVIIGHNASACTAHLLINLGDELPENIDGFERIAEIINDDADNLQRGRGRYASYRQGAYPLHYHEITS